MFSFAFKARIVIVSFPLMQAGGPKSLQHGYGVGNTWFVLCLFPRDLNGNHSIRASVSDLCQDLEPEPGQSGNTEFLLHGMLPW